jgi:hypothetical protein
MDAVVLIYRERSFLAEWKPIERSKRGTPSVHPIQGDELRALRRLQREQPASPYVRTAIARRRRA